MASTVKYDAVLSFIYFVAGRIWKPEPRANSANDVIMDRMGQCFRRGSLSGS